MAERGPDGKFLTKEQQQQQTGSDLPGVTPAPEVVRVDLTAGAVGAPEAGADISADVEVVAAIAMPEYGTPEYEKYVENLRQRRRIFGQSTQKLALPERPGYHRHWFNDSPGRVEEALNNGWAHVVGRDRKIVSRIVGSGRDNKALLAYAMELPLPIWEEDQARVAKTAQDKIDGIKGGGAFRAPAGQAKPSDEGKFYSPREEPIKMGESLVKS